MKLRSFLVLCAMVSSTSVWARPWGSLCEGLYSGEYSNGRKANLQINNYGNGNISVSINLMEPYETQNASGSCRDYGDRADFSFAVTDPHAPGGHITHSGSIYRNHNGAFMQGTQLEFGLGFTFSQFGHNPPPPPPPAAYLCSGYYSGNFQDGRTGAVQINNYGNGIIAVTIYLQNEVQTANGSCQENGNFANIQFAVMNPSAPGGQITYVGNIQQQGRRTVMQGYQREFNFGFNFERRRH